MAMKRSFDSMESGAGSSSGSGGSGSGLVVGIDLGTTYSVVGVCRKGRVEIFCNDSGSRITPSVVGFMGGQMFVGDAAKDLPAVNQVYDAKRLIGRPWIDVCDFRKRHWPFTLVEKNGEAKIRTFVNGSKKDFCPVEISAMVLRGLKEIAEGVLQERVTRAVVTVPAYFNERQRQATKLAGTVAGLEIIAMINEPTAAAIAYALDKKKSGQSESDKKTVFIYDLGGGTFDVSVLTAAGSEYTVLASDGDTNLGGQDFDERLLHHFIEEVRTKHGVNLDPTSVQELRKVCELVKRKLSTLAEVPISHFFSRHNLAFKSSITRARFESLIIDLLKKTLITSSKVITESKLQPGDIDEVVLVGGSTRIPKVTSLLRELFVDKEPRRSINPDEAVAFGAAVHAATLSGDKYFSNLVKLRDVTPLSLGIDTVGGLFSPVIPRNTPVPCERTSQFSNAHDYQTAVNFKVFQGERPLSKDNYYLKKEFSVSVPPKPRNENKLDCTFNLDANGLLTVWAIDKETGNRGQVTINPKDAKVSEKELETMLKNAQKLRDMDQKAKQKLENEYKRQCL
ncbi:endoplasmic reticulum chaperone BiP-like [Thrips palmi]|uniref:Endoplasmic reticulum chaperone BiP-like n=1 Tax=Thrips palmi TaxID=161013 RepID=A0A6P8Z6H0_THRPL|nr:endoplasmic reticulum chaperone BiP-like [Thrips palmi]